MRILRTYCSMLAAYNTVCLLRTLQYPCCMHYSILATYIAAYLMCTSQYPYSTHCSITAAYIPQSTLQLARPATSCMPGCLLHKGCTSALAHYESLQRYAAAPRLARRYVSCRALLAEAGRCLRTSPRGTTLFQLSSRACGAGRSRCNTCFPHAAAPMHVRGCNMCGTACATGGTWLPSRWCLLHTCMAETVPSGIWVEGR